MRWGIRNDADLAGEVVFGMRLNQVFSFKGSVREIRYHRALCPQRSSSDREQMKGPMSRSGFKGPVNHEVDRSKETGDNVRPSLLISCLR